MGAHRPPVAAKAQGPAATSTPLTWWWGRGGNPQGIPTVVDTRTGGSLRSTPSHLGPVPSVVGAYVVAVTDDGVVIIRRDDGHLASTVTDDRARERMARCRPLPAECVLVRTD